MKNNVKIIFISENNMMESRQKTVCSPLYINAHFGLDKCEENIILILVSKQTNKI